MKKQILDFIELNTYIQNLTPKCHIYRDMMYRNHSFLLKIKAEKMQDKGKVTESAIRPC